MSGSVENNKAEMTVSQQLKEAREAAGLSLDVIAKKTCVRTPYIEALESGDFEALPDPAFTAGFVRSLAKEVGLNADDLVSAYRAEVSADKPEPVIAVQEAATPWNVPFSLPGWLAPITGLAGLAATWAFLSAATSTQMPERAEVLELPATLVAQTPSATISEPIAEPVAEEVEAYKPAGSTTSIFPAAIASVKPEAQVSGELLLVALEDSWLRLVDDKGHEIWSGVLREGDEYRPQVSGTVFLTTSNAGGMAIRMSGQDLAPLGVRGQIIEAVKLDHEMLVSDNHDMDVLHASLLHAED